MRCNFTKVILRFLLDGIVAVLACMDARLDPARILGLEEGDAHVIRNAGGRAADALRSLVISEQLLATEHNRDYYHTDCGMLTFTNDQIHAKIKQELHADADHIDFLHSQTWSNRSATTSPFSSPRRLFQRTSRSKVSSMM